MATVSPSFNLPQLAKTSPHPIHGGVVARQTVFNVPRFAAASVHPAPAAKTAISPVAGGGGGGSTPTTGGYAI